MHGSIEHFFLSPSNSAHKKYEALRALCVDKLPVEEVAQKFGYTKHTVNSLKRDFIRGIKNGTISEESYFLGKNIGRNKKENMDKISEMAISLRKQNYSILDIKTIIESKGHNISYVSIHKILKKDGFTKLPKRSTLEKKFSQVTSLNAPKSSSINWVLDNDKTFSSERGVGLLAFLPLLSELKVDEWITQAGYPETQSLNRIQNVLSFLVLKLAGNVRYNHDDLWAMDRSLGLFSSLNVLPKTSTLSSYSYRVTRKMNREFLKSMNKAIIRTGINIDRINMDFTTIPHWGDESILENNWSGKRNKGLKSIQAALCQCSDSGLFMYSDAEVRKSNQSDFILEFVDFWKEGGESPSMLIFDSKFTVYKNLKKLDDDGIKFITLRRRGKKLIEETTKIAEEEWSSTTINGTRKRKKIKYFESQIELMKGFKVRQIIIKDNGHEKPSFFITNDHKKTVAQIVRQYGKRWGVEKGISEQIEFFHLNSLSSSIVVKVDFDLTMSICAHNLYRIIAQRLSGFENENSESLSNKFFSNGGQLTIDQESIKVELKKKRHLPVLLEYLQSSSEKIKWLDNKLVTFGTMTTT